MNIQIAKKIPVYGLLNHKPRFCLTHKTTEMINLNSKRCEHPNCQIQSVYGLLGQQIQFCAKHKTDDMIDLISKLCNYTNCKKIAIFRLSNQKTLYCASHKTDNMIDVKNKRCEHPNCQVRSHFGLLNHKPRFCKSHKTTEMINLKSKRCSHQNCQTQPNFGLPNHNPRYCLKHKTEEMIDVKHKRCERETCNTTANYGFLFNKPMYCAKHKFLGMYPRNKLNPKCVICKNPAYRGKKYPEYCHKHGNYLNDLVSTECTNCNLCYVKDQDLCEDCDFYLNTKGRIWHKKEEKIKNLLTKNNIPFIHDKILPETCLKYRPDFVIDCDTFYLMVEVDEFQHRSKSYKCECSRMINLAQGIGMPTIFIRFNPDMYIVGNEKIKNYGGRERELLNVINGIMNKEIVKDMLTVYYMFYDDYTILIPEVINMDNVHNFDT